MKPAAHLKPPSSTHGFMSVSLCRCCCFFKRKRKKNTPRHKWSSTPALSVRPHWLWFPKSIRSPSEQKEADEREIWTGLFSGGTSLKWCWDVQDALCFDGSLLFFLSFSCFFPPLRCLEMMLQASPNEKPCCWNFAADNLFLFFLSKALVIWISLALFWGKLFLCFSRGGDGCCCFFCFFWESYHLQPCFYPPPACLESQLQRYPPVCLSTCLDFFLTWDWM